MRTLLSVAEMTTGGAERMVAELARGLLEVGDAVAVAGDTGDFDRLLDESDAKRYPLPGRGRSPVTAARAAWGLRSPMRSSACRMTCSKDSGATGFDRSGCG